MKRNIGCIIAVLVVSLAAGAAAAGDNLLLLNPKKNTILVASRTGKALLTKRIASSSLKVYPGAASSDGVLTFNPASKGSRPYIIVTNLKTGKVLAWAPAPKPSSDCSFASIKSAYANFDSDRTPGKDGDFIAAGGKTGAGKSSSYAIAYILGCKSRQYLIRAKWEGGRIKYASNRHLFALTGPLRTSGSAPASKAAPLLSTARNPLFFQTVVIYGGKTYVIAARQYSKFNPGVTGIIGVAVVYEASETGKKQWREITAGGGDGTFGDSEYGGGCYKFTLRQPPTPTGGIAAVCTPKGPGPSVQVVARSGRDTNMRTNDYDNVKATTATASASGTVFHAYNSLVAKIGSPLIYSLVGSFDRKSPYGPKGSAAVNLITIAGPDKLTQKKLFTPPSGYTSLSLVPA